ISSVRWNVGTDWYSYSDFYRDILMYHSNPHNYMETGFTYYNLFFHYLGAPYSMLLAVSACLMIGLKAKVFFDHKKVMMLCLFLFYCYYLADIFGVRQYLAIALCVYSIRYIEKQRFVPFLVIILLATSIHVTSIVFLLSYWLYKLKYSLLLLYFSLVLAFIGGFFDLGTKVAELVMHLAGVDSRVGTKLTSYLKYTDEYVPGNPYINYAVGVLKRALFIPLFVYRQRFIGEADRPKYTGYLNLLVFGNIIYLFFSLSMPMIARLSTDFLFFEIFVLAYTLQSFKKNKIKLLFFLLVLLFGAFRLYNLMSVYWDLYMPSETIFAPINIRRE
ncbi:MAG TPA: EpsG family protein, partial [Pseudosphingobacterium sp.]|nr:EpsG family protein [Pseudosphingobacterium sp.]